MKSTCKTLEQLEQTADSHSDRVNDKQERNGGSRPILHGTEQTTRLLPSLFGGFRRSASVEDGNHSWLIRIGLMPLVCGMMELSVAYDFPWAASWEHHLDNPLWLGKAMAQTFERLSPEDKDTVRMLYDDWLWFENHVDMQALVTPEFNALCYMLDSKGKRVCNVEGPVTVLRGLKGRDKQEALKTLDKQRYEFKAWW